MINFDFILQHIENVLPNPIYSPNNELSVIPNDGSNSGRGDKFGTETLDKTFTKNAVK